MRIALVCPDNQSIILLCEVLINTLKAKGDTTIYAVAASDSYSRDVEALGATCIPVRLNRYVAPTSDMAYLIALYRICRRHHIDVVINFTTKPNIYGAIAARCAKVPTSICSIRGLGSPFVPNSSTKTKLIKALVIGLYWVSCRLNTETWFTNAVDLDYLVSRRVAKRSKSMVIGENVNLQHFSPSLADRGKVLKFKVELGIEEDDVVVTMVARLLWAKGVREFVEASEILGGKYPNAKFLLVGPPETGNLGAVPVDFLREKEKSGRFHWLGFIKDIREIYALSDIAVLPSYYKEGGFPRALLEPMAMEKPVIAADTDHCRGPVEEGKNGYLVPPKNASELAGKIETLIIDKEKRIQFGRYSRIKIEREFDERVIVEKMIQRIAQLHGH